MTTPSFNVIVDENPVAIVVLHDNDDIVAAILITKLEKEEVYKGKFIIPETE